MHKRKFLKKGINMKSNNRGDKPVFDLKEIKRRVICEAAATAMLAQLNASKNQTLKLIGG